MESSTIDVFALACMISLPISERDNHAFSYMAETENGVFEISHWAKTCIKAHAILHKCYFHLALLRHFERMLSLSSGKCCNRLDHKRCRKEGWGGKTEVHGQTCSPSVFEQTATCHKNTIRKPLENYEIHTKTIRKLGIS